MTITNQPANNGIYFQKNIPNIELQKSSADTFILFSLSVEGSVVLTEKYVYDVSSKISIKFLQSVIEKYFYSTQLILSCSFSITQGGEVASSAFKVINCEADMTAVNASTWVSTRFLTRMKNDKRTAVNQNEFLSFVKKPEYGGITVHAEINYYDAAGAIQQLNTTLDAIAAAGSMMISTFNCSVSKIRALLAAGSVVFNYSIWLTGSGFTTSKYTFLPDYSPYRSKTNFVFENCFGCLETFTATGVLDIKKMAEYTLNNVSNKYRKLSQDFKAEKVVNSGFQSTEEMDWLDDLLNSYSIGITIPGSGVSEEVTLTTVSKTDTRANVLQSFEFACQLAANNHNQFFAKTNGIFDYTFDSTFN